MNTPSIALDRDKETASPIPDRRLQEVSEFLSEVDGFLAALAIGPEEVPPGEWLPEIWETTEGEAAAIVRKLLLGRLHDIRAQIPACRYLPFVAKDDGGFPIPSHWCNGFLRGMFLRKEAWTPLLHSNRHRDFLAPLIAFACDEDGRVPLSGVGAVGK